MSDRLAAQVRRLEQTQSVWQASVRLAPSWVVPKGKPAYRPFLALVVDPDADKVRITHIFEQRPTPEEVASLLAKAMRRPSLGAGRRCRPACIGLDDNDLVTALQPMLAKMGVACVYRASLPYLDDAVRSFAAYLDEDALPGLLSVPGVSRPLAEELFAAVAEFHRKAPWAQWPNDLAFEVCYPPEGKPCYAIVMGSGGDSFGLSVYESLQELIRVLTATDEETAHAGIACTSIVLVEARALPFEDLDAIAKYGWEVDGDEGYPLVVKLAGDGTFGRPNADEIARLAAVARVLPTIVDRLVRGRPADQVELTCPLPPVHGGKQLVVYYPPKRAYEEDELLKAAKHVAEIALESFIEDWYWDEASHTYARAVGSFLMGFLFDLAGQGLSPETMEKHQRNCWVIGSAECDHNPGGEFSPTVFLEGPRYMGAFVREAGSSKSALASYRATWNKLARYVRDLGFEEPKA